MKRVIAMLGGLFTNQAPHTGDYPWGPISDALESTLARLILFFALMLISLSLGTAFAYGSLAGFLVGIVDVHWVLINSLFYSLGSVVFPAALIFAILFIRYEWPLRSLLLPSLAFIYVSYDSTNFAVNHSRAAQFQKAWDKASQQSPRTFEINPDKRYPYQITKKPN